MTDIRHWVLRAAFFAGALAATQRARAYTIDSAISDGCHESITTQALREARKTRPGAAAIPSTGEDNALIDDLPFEVDRDMRDIGAVSLLLGVRDNDLKGKSPKDLSRLAAVHGDPELQAEHCLRAPDRAEPDGSRRALDDCRAFILRRVAEAVDAVQAGTPDPRRRVDVPMHLSIRGPIDVSLVVYFVRMGQAVHAVQDSFTHTYRTPDGRRITVILDWINTVRNMLNEPVTGPPHADVLDRCDDPDEPRKVRRLLAIEATRALLDVTLDETKGRDEKLAAANAVLDQHLGYEPGCTFENKWCNAVENAYQAESACGCRTAGAGGGASAVVALGAGLATFAARRRRRRSAARAAGLGVLLLGLFAAPPSRAQEKSAPEKNSEEKKVEQKKVQAEKAEEKKADEATARAEKVEEKIDEAERAREAPPPPKPESHTPEPGPKDKTRPAFGAAAGFGGSLDRAAVFGHAGLRLRLNERWAFGLDGEWNPFLAYTGETLRSGTLNVYGSAYIRFPLAWQSFNLRTSLSLGVSRLLVDLYGAPRGSTGLFAGFQPLAVEWKATRAFYVVFSPIGVALPIPQLSGVPFVYPQYRTSVGIELYF